MHPLIPLWKPFLCFCAGALAAHAQFAEGFFTEAQNPRTAGVDQPTLFVKGVEERFGVGLARGGVEDVYTWRELLPLFNRLGQKEWLAVEASAKTDMAWLCSTGLQQAVRAGFARMSVDGYGCDSFDSARIPLFAQLNEARAKRDAFFKRMESEPGSAETQRAISTLVTQVESGKIEDALVGEKAMTPRLERARHALQLALYAHAVGLTGHLVQTGCMCVGGYLAPDWGYSPRPVDPTLAFSAADSYAQDIMPDDMGFMLIHVYLYGWGTPADPKSAFELAYMLSCMPEKEKRLPATAYLAVAYGRGLGVEKSPELAQRAWDEFYAEDGHADAYMQLAAAQRIYAGWGFPKDPVLATEMLERLSQSPPEDSVEVEYDPKFFLIPLYRIYSGEFNPLEKNAKKAARLGVQIDALQTRAARRSLEDASVQWTAQITAQQAREFLLQGKDDSFYNLAYRADLLFKHFNDLYFSLSDGAARAAFVARIPEILQSAFAGIGGSFEGESRRYFIRDVVANKRYAFELTRQSDGVAVRLSEASYGAMTP